MCRLLNNCGPRWSICPSISWPLKSNLPRAGGSLQDSGFISIHPSCRANPNPAPARTLDLTQGRVGTTPEKRIDLSKKSLATTTLVHCWRPTHMEDAFISRLHVVDLELQLGDDLIFCSPDFISLFLCLLEFLLCGGWNQSSQVSAPFMYNIMYKEDNVASYWGPWVSLHILTLTIYNTEWKGLYRLGGVAFHDAHVISMPQGWIPGPTRGVC